MHKASPLLIVIVIGLLAACNNNDNNDANNASPIAEETPTLVRQQPAPIQQQDTQEPDEEPDYDPGPYFTPRRQSPGDPATFVPAEQIGDFTQIQLRGNCLRGQQSQYINSDNQVVHLTCRFMLRSEDAQNAIREIVTTNGLTGDPILMKIQGDESFLLGPSGNGFTYAWNHGQWFFIARSPVGRPALDSFMEALPF